MQLLFIFNDILKEGNKTFKNKNVLQRPLTLKYQKVESSYKSNICPQVYNYHMYYLYNTYCVFNISLEHYTVLH